MSASPWPGSKLDVGADRNLAEYELSNNLISHWAHQRICRWRRRFKCRKVVPSEEGLALDALAAASWLRSAGFPPGRTVYVGQSLGTGVVVRLAATHPPGAMLLQSPYTSMVAFAQGKFLLVPFDLLLKDRFDTMRYLPVVTMPITVLAGGRDTLVPVSQSAAVAEASPNLFRYVETANADHNDIYWSGPGLPAEVDELARAALHI